MKQCKESVIEHTILELKKNISDNQELVYSLIKQALNNKELEELNSILIKKTTKSKQDLEFDINQALAARYENNKKVALINSAIIDRLKLFGDFPERWYVNKPNQKVCDYINQKYGTQYTKHKGNQVEFGLGEVYGNTCFVPHDMLYSFEITQAEFDLIIQLKKKIKKTELSMGEILYEKYGD